jgi:glycerophosphoryl diester phosphodiesterase
MRPSGRLQLLVCGAIVAFLFLGVRAAESRPRLRPGTIDQLLDLDVRPFAIGHHGAGENRGEDPSKPIENTVASVRLVLEEGVSVVEVDVQLTRDGHVAVFHDDFLADFTCINRLTLAELQEREPQLPSLESVLEEVRRFNRSRPLRGLGIIELKAASPLCDPGDTEEPAIISAVTKVVRQMDMTNQVMLMSFSPALLFLAAAEAPEIVRDLGINGLQFLGKADIEALLGLPVKPIDKRLDLGLQWGEAGLVFRLPAYRSVAEVFSTAVIVGARVVEADLSFLSSAGAPFVEALHGLGLKALGFTATNPTEWFFLESLGLDGIYTDDVPFGVQHQAPIP